MFNLKCLPFTFISVFGKFNLTFLTYHFFLARQCSSRGGELRIDVKEDNRVDIAGQAVLVLQGNLRL